MKTCKKCFVEFSIESFRLIHRSNGSIERQGYCKKCDCERIRESRRRRGIWYNQKPSLKTVARHAVNNAIASRRLLKPVSCAHCGEVRKVHGHHHAGYEIEHVLDVIWLCHDCHKEQHPKKFLLRACAGKAWIRSVVKDTKGEVSGEAHPIIRTCWEGYNTNRTPAAREN